MDKSEIIERLKNIAGHAVHTVGERPFIMSLDDGIAVHEAIELLKKAETNCPEIPDSWIPVTKKMPAEKSKGFIRVSDALYDLYGKDPRRLWSFQDIEKWLRSLRPVDISYLENAANMKEDGWLERNKDRILRAGLEGREVEFRIGGRLFAIREKAQ